ncbi:glycosyltransferase [Micromonospora sp. DT43]|uniref:glycosyltransferase n=1 Tax=Micromonospora sp. DT43 TaxID=3393440 RepID=UPI003CEF0643
MTRFLMVTHGSAGDVLPIVRIGRELAGRGHEVTLTSHAPYAARARAAGLEFVPLDTTESYARHQVESRRLIDARTSADLRLFYERTGLFDQMRAECTAMIERHRPGETVLVGRHTSGASTLLAGEMLGAPTAWVALAPIQIMASPAAVAHLQRALGDGVNEVRAGFGLAPVTDWAAWFASPRSVLGLWPQWYDAAGPPSPPETSLTGFVGGDEVGGDEQEAGDVDVPAGELLVTGGTGQLLHPRFYEAALDAVASTGRTALVVAPERDLLPAVLPPGVRWFASLPFPRVVPRVAAVVHHGGIGTAVRAVRDGVPQVILAHGADRPDNAQRLASAGLARWLPAARWSAAAIAGEIGAAVADGGYASRAAAFSMLDDAGPATAADALVSLTASRPDTGAPLRERLRQMDPAQLAALTRQLSERP